MSGLLACLPLAIVRDLGWTLLNFLWQGVLLAAFLNVILPLCRGAAARHNWALGTLAMMAVAPVLTFLAIHDFGANGPAIVGEAAGPAALLLPPPAALPWTSWLVLFWLAGIMLLSARALGGWCVARSLMRSDTLAVPAELLARCQRLQRRLAMTGPVRLLLSRRVRVPVVVGVLRPLILIPVSALAGLPPAQLDALILHELAHIRRFDPVTNIFLVAVETILFYHPAIWWVARKVRIEREHACDDFAVSACGDAALYVEALTSLEAWKTPYVLAANGGGLKRRVARLLEAPGDTRRVSLSALAGLAFLGFVAGSVALAQPGKKIDTDFAICAVDDGVAPDARSGPPGDVRMPAMLGGKRTYIWLKRQSLMTDVLADARPATGADGRPIIAIRLNAQGGQRFAALTRANLGDRLAVIVDGTVITAPKVLEPILGAKIQIDGFHSQEEARETAARMMAAASPAPSAKGPAYRPTNSSYPSDDRNPVMLRPIPGTHTLPPYPKESAHAQETGMVTLAVAIGMDGAPRDVKLLHSSGHDRLDVQAAQYVKGNWRWEPPMRNGRPVTATTNVKVKFDLHENTPPKKR